MINQSNSNGFDTESRMAEINGHPQRIPPIPDDELSEEVRALSMGVRASFGAEPIAHVPEFMSTVSRHPGLYKVIMDMGVLLIRHGALPPRERELAILRNAWLCGAPYEWGEHVDIAQRNGVSKEEVARCVIGSTAPGWTTHDRAILRGVEELHDNKFISDETWATLSAKWNDQQMIEFPVLIGQYISTALLQNSLRTRLMHDNPGLGYR